MNKQMHAIQNLSQWDLPDQEVHIWYAQMPESLAVSSLISLLSQAEKDRYDAYKSPAKQAEFLFGRFFLKQMLAAYLHKPASEIQVEINQYKRPYLPDQELQFNLSHSFGAFALIISKKYSVGIDVEYCLRKLSIEDGRHVFMPEEIQSMKAKDPKAAKQEFLERWTLKEAIYKAADKGTALLFNEFSVDLQTLSVFSKSPLLSTIHRKLGVSPILGDYLLAYAIENPEKDALRIQQFQGTL